VTGWAFEKIAQNVAQPVFCQNLCITLSVEKSSQNVGNFCNFRKTARSKQSPKGQKFAQSGHPGHAKEMLSR
jgi:hypothetical protein